MIIEEVPTNKINPAEYNPRTISKEALKGLKNSIDKFGYVEPIVWNKKTGNLVSGHQRFKVVGHNGSVKAVVVDLSLKDEKALNITMNNRHIQGDWELGITEELLKELKLELPEFDDIGLGNLADELKIDLGLNGYDETKDDEVPEPPKEARLKLGDLVELGDHRLLCGDSTVHGLVIELMNNQESELLFTSPPYSDMRDYNGNKNLDVEYLAEFIGAFSFYANYQVINLGIKRENNEIVPYWDNYIAMAKDSGYKFLSWNVWNRSNASSIGNQTAFFPIHHEWLFVFGKEKSELNRTVKNKTAGSSAGTNRQKDGTTKKSKGVTAQYGKIGTVQNIGVASGKLHPAMFPVELPEEYIKAMTQENDIVLEPFLGSGTTLIACEKTNRKCYGMELDPIYCDVIVQRWCDYTNQSKVKINGEEIDWIN